MTNAKWLHFDVSQLVFYFFNMAMSGKKGKKAKGKTLNLQDFLSENGGGTSGSIVTKSLSWANECEDDDYLPPKIITYSIPTAPRSQRVLDESTIPQNPPYLAHISNLSFDLNEQDIKEYFESVTNYEVVSVRLPREDGETGRMRGFGYIEFADREGLIAAVSLPDLQLRNRNIRIDVSNEQEQKRGGNRGRYDNFGSSSENRDTNWRGGRDNGRDESGRRDRDRGGSSIENGGNWRSERTKMSDSPPPQRRDRYGDRGDRGDRDGRGDRGDRDGRGGRDGERRRPEPLNEERPRLKLQPRTLPLPDFNLQIDERDKAETEKPPEKPKPTPVPAAAIFGSAKPVDTAAKDREIEERLERERVERMERLEREAKEAKEKAQNEEPDEAEAEAEAETETEAEAEASAPEPSEAVEPNGLEEEQEEKKAPAEKPEIVSWRRKPDEDGGRASSPSRKRYSPDRRRRQNDDRDRRNNDRDRRDRGDRDPNRSNFNRDKRDYNRDYHQGPRSNFRNDRNDRNQPRNQSRTYNNRDSRDNRDNRDNRGPPQPREDREKPRRTSNPEEIENRMPKLKPDVKPKLQMSNPYEIFNDDQSE